MAEKLADFVIISALQEELEALLEKFPSAKRLPPSNKDVRIYYQVDLPVTFSDGTTGTYRLVFLSQLGMGRVQAASAANDAIKQWHPHYMLLVGIAGGITEAGVQRGDVLISDQIVDYELQKLTPNGEEIRWEVHRADARLLETVRHLGENWRRLIKKRRPSPGRPKRSIGPMATGDKVIAVKDVLDCYRDIWPKLIGIEMEAGGVASAVYQSVDQPGFLMVRGVSDLADEHKDDTWRSYACHAAAAYVLALLQSGPVPFSKQEEGGNLHRDHQDHITPREVSHKYLRWLEETTVTFLVPGLGVRLPIEQAWIHLQALGDTVEVARPSTLAEKIAYYHEWERLSYHEHAYPAQDVTEFGHRVVVIGGPGAGKSTLCQRTAHLLARSGERILRVRLPFVAQRCFTDGESIDQAILSVATAGSGIQPQVLMSAFNAPDCLLADGLDECGAYIVGIAEQLRAWAYARPHTRVVVATRPIGYDRAFFDDWKHVELLPLGTDHIEDHVRNILMHVETDRAKLERKIRQFQSQIKTNRIASMAARSPLLLGFLVQLAHHGIAFARHRAALYEQVLTLWYQMPPKERSITASEPGAAFAHEVLNRAGWLLHQASPQPGGRSGREMIDALASQLCDNGQSLLAAKEKVERCLAFWQERGVLELLQVGHEDAYTFIHATLGEYAAGRYLATCDDSKIRTHLEKVRHDARWRETLLLAAGAGKANIIAEHLLTLDRENDPVATESLLAAAALAESAHTSPALAAEVAKRITNRLCSAIPLVAYESAQNSTGLVALLTEEMKPLLHPLLRHPQLWTRLTALRLSLAAGDSVVDYDALEAFFDDWLAPKDASELGESPPPQTTQDIRKYILGRREPWGTFNEVLALGAEALVRVRPGKETATRLERLARLHGGINDSALNALLQGLKRLGHADIADQIWKEYMVGINDIHWDSITKKYRQADQALLEAVLRVTGAAPSTEGNQRRPIALSMLIQALQLPQCGVEDWFVLDERQDLAAVDVVLAGTIVALDLDQTEVAIDAAWALVRITDTLQARDADTALLSLLPQLPVEPDWERAVKGANLSPSDLVRALRHPSHAIAISAAQLLAAGAGGPDAPSLLEDVLEQGDDFALQMVALAARSVWGKKAFAKLLHRLNSPLSRGCRWLLRELPHVSDGQTDEQMREVLIHGLAAADPQVAIAAAETLQSLSDTFLEPGLLGMQVAFTLWSTRGDYCEKHQRYFRGACCDRVPLCPRAAILKLRVRFSALKLPELLDACRDPHSNVRTVATQEATRVLASQPEDIAEVVDDVAKGHHPASVLEAILSMPATALISSQEALINLFSAESAVIRRIVVRKAATATWLSKEQAVNAAQVALKDSDLTVRNLAVDTLRSLRRSS